MNTGRRHGFWRLRPLAGFAAAFCLMAAVWLRFGWIPTAVVFLASCPLAVLAKGRTARFALAGLAAGVVWITLWYGFTLDPIMHLQGRGGFYTVELTDYAQGHVSYGTVLGELEYDGRRCKVLVYLSDGSPALSPGDRIRLEGGLTCMELLTNRNAPEGVWLRLDQTGDCIVTAGEPRTLTQRLRVWNRTLGDRAERLLPGPAGGLLKALLTGDRAGIPAENTAHLSRSGLSHIAAVSGLHLSVLAGLMVRFLGQKTGRILAIPTLVLFTAFTGFSPSALRALVLWCFLLGAWSLRRRSDPMTALASALLLQVAANPCALLSVSLQLSFAAVCGLVLLGPACRELLPQRRRWKLTTLLPNLLHTLGGALLTTLSATVFTVPLLLYYFSTFSLAAPLANLLTLWTVAPAMILGALAMLLFPLVPALSGVLLMPAGLLLDWLLGCAGYFSALPWAALTADLPLVWIAAAALILTGILAVRQESFRSPAGIVTAGLTLCLLLICSYTEFHTDRLILTGARGSVTLTAITREGTLVLDPGPYTGGSLGETLAEQLWVRGVAAPDYAVATGSHVSRAGGLPDLCGLMLPEHILAPRDAYLFFEQHPRNAFLLPEGSLRMPFGSLQILPCGREDRYAWLLQLRDTRILSVCGAAARPFLVKNQHLDLQCDLLILDDSMLGAPDALATLLDLCRPAAVVLPTDAYTDPIPLRDRWQGETLVLESWDMHIYILWRD